MEKKKTTLCFSRCVGKTLDCESAVATERLERCFHLFFKKITCLDVGDDPMFIYTPSY